MNSLNRSFTAAVIFVYIIICGTADWMPAHAEQEAGISDAQRLQWWREARFGMFVHWGPVSLTGHEIGWSRGAETPVEVYDNLYKKFNPTNFNADEWVQVAEDAGMKYLVFTTKHHDGFCMWDTKQTDFNIMNSPFGRDVVKELSEACERGGIRFCTYHSVCDWHHPDFPLTSPGGRARRETYNLDHYEEYLRAQLKELITNYGPLGLIWFDVPQEFDRERGQGLIDYVRSLQPDVIVNNRSGAPGDYDTPEQRVGKYQDDRPWETCMTICRQWSWKPNDEMKSLEECIQTLIRCAGGDGNLLLNVGPTPAGVIERRQVERLREMGAWLKKYGETIYGTRGGPWKPTGKLASTRKGNFIYLHVLRSTNGRVELPAVPYEVKSVDVLGGGAVEIDNKDGMLVLKLEQAVLDRIDTVIRIEMNGSAMDIPAMTVGREIKATASNVFRNMQDTYGPQLAFDNISETRWATDAGTEQAWIIAEFDKPIDIGAVRISEASPYTGRVQEFEFQYRDREEWETVFTGGEIGGRFFREFNPIMAREFRLNILDAEEGPTISELEIEDE